MLNKSKSATHLPLILEKVDAKAVDRYRLEEDPETGITRIRDYYPDKKHSPEGKSVGMIHRIDPNIRMDVIQLKTDDQYGNLMVLVHAHSGLLYSVIPGAHIKMKGLEVKLDKATGNVPSPVKAPSSGMAAAKLHGQENALSGYNVFILGAGVSSRMLPMAGDERTLFCKPAMWLFDAPMIYKLLETLSLFGLKKVIINTYVNPLSLEDGMARCGEDKFEFSTLFETQLNDSVSNLKSASGDKPYVYFIREEKVSGTAGPLRKLMEWINAQKLPRTIFDPEKPLLVVQGDAVTNADFARLVSAHEQNHADITIACKEVPKEEANQFGMILTDKTGPNGSGVILEFREKPKEMSQVPNPPLASTGFYVISPRVLSKIRMLYAHAPNPDEFDYAKNIFTPLVAGAHLAAQEAPVKFYAHVLDDEEYWGDFGNPESYISGVLEVAARQTQLQISEHNPCGISLPQNIDEYVDLSNEVVYAPGARELSVQDQIETLKGGVLVKQPYQP